MFSVKVDNLNPFQPSLTVEKENTLRMEDDYEDGKVFSKREKKVVVIKTVVLLWVFLSSCGSCM